MRTFSAALFLVLALGVTACTDDNPSDPSSTPSESGPVGPTETPASDGPPARDVCKVLEPDEVGEVLGADVEATIGEEGCRFASPDDPDAASLGIVQGELAALGGIDGAKLGIGAVVEGEAEDLAGVGDGAFVVVGPAMSATLTGAGAVALGPSLIQITVIPGPDATDDDVRRMTVGALTLIAERARR